MSPPIPTVTAGGRDLALDARILVEKQEAGAEFAISQLFFSASRYVELVERARRAGADLPIVPGIMPVTSVGQLDRFGDLSGTPLPVSFTKPLRALADDPDTFREVALALILKLIEDLRLAGGPRPAVLHAQSVAGDDRDSRQAPGAGPTSMVTRRCVGRVSAT